MDTLVICQHCGGTIKVSESIEAGLVDEGVMVKFYHCADRPACRDRQASGRVQSIREFGRVVTTWPHFTKEMLHNASNGTLVVAVRVPPSEIPELMRRVHLAVFGQ